MHVMDIWCSHALQLRMQEHMHISVPRGDPDLRSSIYICVQNIYHQHQHDANSVAEIEF